MPGNSYDPMEPYRLAVPLMAALADHDDSTYANVAVSIGQGRYLAYFVRAWVSLISLMDDQPDHPETAGREHFARLIDAANQPGDEFREAFLDVFVKQGDDVAWPAFWHLALAIQRLVASTGGIGDLLIALKMHGRHALLDSSSTVGRAATISAMIAASEADRANSYLANMYTHDPQILAEVIVIWLMVIAREFSTNRSVVALEDGVPSAVLDTTSPTTGRVMKTVNDAITAIENDDMPALIDAKNVMLAMSEGERVQMSWQLASSVGIQLGRQRATRNDLG